MFDVSINGTILTFNWKVVKSAVPSAGDVKNVTLEWEDIQYGNCLPYTPPKQNNSFKSTAAASSHTVDTTLLWTQFRVTLTAVDAFGISTSQSKLVTTAQLAPNGTVENVEAKELTETSVILSWAPPKCANRGGEFLNYLVNIIDAETKKPAKEGKPFITPLYNVTDLSPGTTYTVIILFVNRVSKDGPSAAYNFTMKGSSKLSLLSFGI